MVFVDFEPGVARKPATILKILVCVGTFRGGGNTVVRGDQRDPLFKTTAFFTAKIRWLTKKRSSTLRNSTRRSLTGAEGWR
jgi:hypothetical protein